MLIAGALTAGVILYTGIDGLQKQKKHVQHNRGVTRKVDGTLSAAESMFCDTQARYKDTTHAPHNPYSNEASYVSPADALAEAANHHLRTRGEAMGGIGQAVTLNSSEKQQLAFLEQHQHCINYC